MMVNRYRGRSSTVSSKREKAILKRILTDYALAFHNLDRQRVLPHYHELLMLIGRADVWVLATPAEIEAWMSSFWSQLRERLFARAT